MPYTCTRNTACKFLQVYIKHSFTPSYSYCKSMFSQTWFLFLSWVRFKGLHHIQRAIMLWVIWVQAHTNQLLKHLLLLSFLKLKYLSTFLNSIYFCYVLVLQYTSFVSFLFMFFLVDQWVTYFLRSHFLSWKAWISLINDVHLFHKGGRLLWC